MLLVRHDVAIKIERLADTSVVVSMHDAVPLPGHRKRGLWGRLGALGAAQKGARTQISLFWLAFRVGGGCGGRIASFCLFVLFFARVIGRGDGG